MAHIMPFQAIRYNAGKINGPVSKVVAPPYDVIDFEQQDALYKSSPHNVVRLILARQYDGDSPTDNHYTRAAKTLDSWMNEGVLQEDPLPSLYVYEQTYTILHGHPAQKKTLVRRGVLVALKLEPFGEGNVFPHEETFPSHKADRFNLMRACRANLSPVFGLVPDQDKSLFGQLEGAIKGKAPTIEITEENGTVNRMWVVNDAATIDKLTKSFEPRKVFIADGHHRYETACNYRRERAASDSAVHHKDPKPYDYVMMMCVPMSDPGLFILPTHRLVRGDAGVDAATVLGKTKELFDQADATDAELAALAESTDGPVRFGLVFGSGEKKILTAKPAVKDAIKQACPGKSDDWLGLDVAILHQVILDGMLGIGEEEGKKKGQIGYFKSVEESLAQVESGEYGLAVLMRPTRIDQVMDVSETGERMPHKSTYFYPKLLSGLTMRKL